MTVLKFIMNYFVMTLIQMNGLFPKSMGGNLSQDRILHLFVLEINFIYTVEPETVKS